MPRRTWLVLLALLGCRPPTEAEVTPQVAETARTRDALSISDELEALIAEGKDSEDDRVYALDQIRQIPDDGSAEYAFARAATAGRVAELRGVKAGKLVGEAERFAELSIERDEAFRGHAAERMLGSLWVMAPPRLLEHGDSEEGLTLLEDLVQAQPDDRMHRLRLGEAYVFLGDPDPAVEHLCKVVAAREGLRPDDDALLTRLLQEVSDGEGDPCAEAEPADAQTP